jgi:hypothetical protein
MNLALGFEKDEMTGHGIRLAASSVLNEPGLWSQTSSNASSRMSTMAACAAPTPHMWTSGNRGGRPIVR